MTNNPECTHLLLHHFDDIDVIREVVMVDNKFNVNWRFLDSECWDTEM